MAARAPVPFLAEALQSVVAQGDEVVLVDHASSPPLAPAAGTRLVRVEDAGGGPALARDAGLAALGGDCDWVALADADDVWEPGKLDAQRRAIAAHPGAAVCFGSALVVDAHGRATGERLGGTATAPGFRELLYERNVIPASSAMVRRDALGAVGGFAAGEPLPAGSDWDLWLRLAAAGYEFVCEPSAAIRYRRHPGGVSSDIARLASAGLLIHARHAALVGQPRARLARAHDLETLARGRIRERDYAAARAALTSAAELRPPGPRERLLRAALLVPGARGLLGRRDPYRSAS